MSSLPFDLERSLHQHGASLRQLAGDLLRDQADADDVVQEVWLSAMQRPPRHGKATSGWLATSLRNVANKLRRGRRRRERREAGASRREATGDHAQLLAQEEQLQRLVAAVHALELPFREAIWRRYFEGMAPREIARRNGEPLATVKSRLQRGLRELREKLGEQCAEWRGALAVAFGIGRGAVVSTGATTAWSGVILMATWTKAVAAIVVIGVVAWFLRTPELESSSASTAETASARPVVAAAVRTPHERDEVVAPGAEATVASQPGSTQHGKQATLRGRCVDQAGAPLAGCTVTLTSGSNEQVMREWLLTHAAPEDVKPEPIATPADGTFAFTFAVAAPFQFFLGVSRDGCYAMSGHWSHIDEGAVIDVGDVVLRPGVRLVGRVVDSADRPQGQVRFGIRPEVQARGEATMSFAWGGSIRSAPDGSFATEAWFAPGRYTLQSMERNIDQPTAVALSLDRPVENVVVVLRDEANVPRIEGRILDEAGNAITGAVLTVTLASAPHVVFTTSRAGGAFVLRGPEGCSGAVQLQVKAPSGFEPPSPAPVVTWGSKDVEVRLKPAAGLTLRVEDQAGAPITDYRVRTLPRDLGPLDHVNHLHVRAKGPFADGTVRIPDVTVGRWLVIIDFPDGSPFLSVREHVQVEAGRANHATLRAERAAQRLLRVTREDGAPVAGVRVQLCERVAGNAGGLGGFSPGPNTTVFREQRWLLNLHNANMAMVVFEGTTDTAGRLMMQGPRGKDLAVRIRGRGLMPVLQVNVRLEPEGELAVVVGAGARLQGRIGPKEAMVELRRRAGVGPGDPFPAGFQPYLQLVRAGLRVPGSHDLCEDDDSAPFEIHDDGTFDVAGLPSGSWQVELKYREKSAAGFNDQVELGRVTLAEGATDRLDVELYRFLPGTLDGEVTWNGAPLVRARISLDAELDVTADGRPGRARADVQTDDLGRFTHLGPAGVYRVDVQRPAESGLFRAFRSPATATLVRGETTRQVFAVAAGVLEVKLLDATGQPAVAVSVFLHTDATPLAATKADGSLRADLPAQTFTLRVLPKSLQSTAAQNKVHREAMVAGRADAFAPYWIEIGSATIEAGRTTSLELRLPPAWDK